jgi:CRP/FNR family transcriptional regulator, cyclic AMP receptor protein
MCASKTTPPVHGELAPVDNGRWRNPTIAPLGDNRLAAGAPYADRVLAGDAKFGPHEQGIGVNQYGSAGARALRLMVGYVSPAGVDPVAMADVAPYWQLVHFASAEQIYAQGDIADRLYVVVSGDVKLSRTSSFGRTVLTLVGPQEMFGALSLFDPGPRMASATALSEVWAVAIDHDIIRAMIRKHPHIAEQFLQCLARRLKRTTDDLADLVFIDSKGRVAKRLLQLARRIGAAEAGALRVVLHLTRAEIGQLAGVGREEVSKSMSEFTRRGWIKVDGPSVLIRSPERLARRAR